VGQYELGLDYLGEAQGSRSQKSTSTLPPIFNDTANLSPDNGDQFNSWDITTRFNSIAKTRVISRFQES